MWNLVIVLKVAMLEMWWRQPAQVSK
jgi:hypothetical protein